MLPYSFMETNQGGNVDTVTVDTEILYLRGMNQCHFNEARNCMVFGNDDMVDSTGGIYDVSQKGEEDVENLYVEFKTFQYSGMG